MSEYKLTCKMRDDLDIVITCFDRVVYEREVSRMAQRRDVVKMAIAVKGQLAWEGSPQQWLARDNPLPDSGC